MIIKLSKHNRQIEYYVISILTFIFQVLFISIAKEFKDEFINYIQILSLSSLIVGLLGSIQFYIKTKKQIKSVLININKEIIKILFLLLIILSLYYFIKEPLLSFLFFTTFISLILILLKSAIYARKGSMIENSYLFLKNNIIKIIIILIAYLSSFNFYSSIIISNLLIIFLCSDIFVFSKLNKKNEKQYSFVSGLNTFIGGSITSFDKLYASKYLTEFITNYYIIFKVASIFQTITEVVFRKERFDITSHKIKKINFKELSNKIYFCLFILIISYFLILNIDQFILILNVIDIKHLISFFEILKTYKFEFLLIGLSFIVNSIASLRYDLIYANYGKNFLILCNFINFIILFLLLVFFANSLETLCYTFFAVQVINFTTLEIINRKYK